MPHKCVRCGNMYKDGSKELLSGCSCGGRFFFFIRKETLIKKAEEVRQNLDKKQIKEMEKDVRDLVSEEVEKEETVILDLETIRMDAPGKYIIDVMNLARGKPVVVSVGEGKYFIDIITLFGQKDKKIKLLK